MLLFVALSGAGCDGGAAPLDASAVSDAATRTDGGVRPGDDAALADAGDPEDRDAATDLDGGPPDAGAEDAGEPAPNLAFVTSASFSADFGSLAAADAECAAAATAAGLDGTYVAWLSTAAVDGATRLGSASGWVRVDGRAFADTLEGLLAGEVFYPLRVDENGDVLDDALVFTGTRNDGVSDTESSSRTNCDDWTTTSDSVSVRNGSVSFTTSGWTSRFNESCAEPRHLYCFGIDRTARVRPVMERGRFAFMTASYAPGGGLAAADAVCQAEADAAGLPGSYRAAVASNGRTIASRFDLSGLPWVRPDGVRIAPTAAAMFSGAPWDAPINVTADGMSYGGYFGVWHGVATEGDIDGVATKESSCNSWAATSDTAMGTNGSINATLMGDIVSARETMCSFTVGKVYCLQR